MHFPLLPLLAVALVCPFVAGQARAHCDSLDGPVVRDAQLALDRGDPTLALKWVPKDNEAEVREAFRATRAVRRKGDDARKLSDRYFFETLVRLHRAGEGEAFTGLKPAGATDPGLKAADAALESGSAAKLADELSAAVREGIATRFRQVLATRARAGEGVDAGRAYAAAYVDYIHFVEAAHGLALHGVPPGHGEEASRK